MYLLNLSIDLDIQEYFGKIRNFSKNLLMKVADYKRHNQFLSWSGFLYWDISIISLSLIKYHLKQFREKI